MRKDSPLAEHSCIHLNDLMNIPLILSRQAMREEMPRWFGETQDKLNIVATYDLLFNTSVMVREGFGYVLGFDGLVNTGPDSDICFRPLEPALESPMYIIWKKISNVYSCGLAASGRTEKEFWISLNMGLDTLYI